MSINVARLDLVSIQLAVLCADEGSLSAAARRSNCSLSAGSQRLTALEDAVGAKLFVRDHKGVHTTNEGKLFVECARSILGQIELLQMQIRAMSQVPNAGLHIS